MQLHLVMRMHQSHPSLPLYLIWLSHLRGDIQENLSGTDLRCKLYLLETSYEIRAPGLPWYEYVPIEVNLPFFLPLFPLDHLRHFGVLLC